MHETGNFVVGQLVDMTIGAAMGVPVVYLLRLQNSMAPVLLKVSGYNGATCTTGSTFNVVVQASGATEFRVKADTGSWSSWVPVSGYATATGITGTRAHTIFVEVKNAAGAITTGQMTVFKL
ncbi:MAG: hypothetical protein K6U74_19475 [Firmicutes bacterium]|nr:hypothetical protein [Bacillota bacterium]